MARCSCAGSSCNCSVQTGSGLTITGKGNASDPFVVSLEVPFRQDNSLDPTHRDFSATPPGAFVTLGLTDDVTDLILPTDAGGRLELLVRQDGTGNTVTWPSNVLWPGGTAPVLTTTTGLADWIDLRRIGDNWVGRLVASEIG